MDGLALAREIKADPEIASTRLILLAGFGKADQSRGIACRRLCRLVLEAGAANCTLELPDQRGLQAPVCTLTSRHRISRSRVALRQRTRVLVAEDNAVNHQVALGQLKKTWFYGGSRPERPAVLEALEHSHYDIILMDCQMPEMDGYEATRRIRARPGQLSPTLYHRDDRPCDAGDSEKCLAAGMDDYISKPIVLETFAAALARGLSARGKTIMLARKKQRRRRSGGTVQRERKCTL